MFFDIMNTKSILNHRRSFYCFLSNRDSFSRPRSPWSHNIIPSGPNPTWLNDFPIVHDRDKFSNHEQSETNRNAENAMGNYLSEYLRKCFRLYENSS